MKICYSDTDDKIVLVKGHFYDSNNCHIISYTIEMLAFCYSAELKQADGYSMLICKTKKASKNIKETLETLKNVLEKGGLYE